MPKTASMPVAVESPTFEDVATGVLSRLQFALARLVTHFSTEIKKASDVERAFGIDHRLGWQVFRLANAKNPLAEGANVPARVSMDKLLRMAEKRGVASDVIEEVRASFDEFERVVKQHAGTRQAFETLMAGCIPERQMQIEREARETMYHAARTLRGASTRVSMMTSIFYPSQGAAEMIDSCNIMGNYGVQRLRAGALIETSALFRDLRGSRVSTVTGEPITESTDIMLPQFCSAPRPTLQVHRGVQSARYMLAGESVGLQSAVDLVFADFLAAGRSRYATPERPWIGCAHATDTPAELQVVDVLMHEELVEQQRPEAAIYDMVPHGQLTKLPDPDREFDRVAHKLEARSLGRGPTAMRMIALPRYVEMIEYVCGQRGWDVNKLRAYRIEIEYPAHTWQVALTLRLPGRVGG